MGFTAANRNQTISRPRKKKVDPNLDPRLNQDIGGGLHALRGAPGMGAIQTALNGAYDANGQRRAAPATGQPANPLGGVMPMIQTGVQAAPNQPISRPPKGVAPPATIAPSRYLLPVNSRPSPLGGIMPMINAGLRAGLNRPMSQPMADQRQVPQLPEPITDAQREQQLLQSPNPMVNGPTQDAVDIRGRMNQIDQVQQGTAQWLDPDRTSPGGVAGVQPGHPGMVVPNNLDPNRRRTAVNNAYGSQPMSRSQTAAPDAANDPAKMDPALAQQMMKLKDKYAPISRPKRSDVAAEKAGQVVTAQTKVVGQVEGTKPITQQEVIDRRMGQRDKRTGEPSLTFDQAKQAITRERQAEARRNREYALAENDIANKKADIAAKETALQNKAMAERRKQLEEERQTIMGRRSARSVTQYNNYGDRTGESYQQPPALADDDARLKEIEGELGQMRGGGQQGGDGAGGYEINGRPIVVRGGKWVFEDTGEPAQ